MKALLSAAGRSFLRAFAASLLIVLPGILAAPDLNGAYGLGVAALIAAIAAGLRAIQVFIPQLAFPGTYGEIIGSFVRAFVAALVVFWIGVLNAPDFHFTKSLAIAAITGAVTAGIRAIQGFLTPGEQPAPNTGWKWNGD